MKSSAEARRGGQVLVLVTLSLLMIGGMMGLAVDLGWAYFREKAAQAAADAGALAAVARAMETATGMDSYTCGTVGCVTPPQPCPIAGNNLEAACIYAANNGFSTADPRQNVLVEASDADTPPTVAGCSPVARHPPTAPCVDVFYWVTVRVSETIPQLFSAILGNTSGIVSARATAAVAQAVSEGSLILTNRENEPWVETTGTNLYLGGTPEIIVPGGILLASSAGGPTYAGYISGGGDIQSPYTYIRTGGSYHINSASGSWLKTPANRSDGSWFRDPFSNRQELFGVSEPPLTTQAMSPIAVPNGLLSAGVCPSGVCPSGYYFSTTWDGAKWVASGDPIVVSNGSALEFSGGNFGNFHFFGGLQVGQATVTFGPGRYVLAGTKNPSIPVLDTDNKAMLLSENQTDAGRIFILTDSSYGGQLDSQAASIPFRQWTELGFSKASIKAGNNSGSRTELFGLNRKSNDLPSELEPFTPVVVWQDQRNSYVLYTNGEPDYSSSCGGDISTETPCGGAVSPPSDTPQLEIWATPFAKYEGSIYQPRGAWTIVQASGVYTGALQLISGALKTQGSGRLVLVGVPEPVLTYVTALVE